MEEKHFPEDGSSWFDQILVYVIQEHKESKDERMATRLAALHEDTHQRHRSVLVKLAQDMNNWYPVKDRYVLLFPSTRGSDTFDTYEYLQKLKDRNKDGDEEKRADLVALGWTFDDNERHMAQMSKMLSENESNTQSNQAAAEERSRLDSIGGDDNGGAGMNVEEEPATGDAFLDDLLGSILI